MQKVLKPIEPPYPEAVARIFRRYPQDEDGYILKLFRVFANSMRFLTSKGVINLLDRESPLSLREREIVILRVTANTRCEYEWGVHVTAFAVAAELTEEQVGATRHSAADARCWTGADQLLIQTVDELCASSTLTDSTLARFQQQWEVEQQLEIMALVGNYHTVSFVANVTRLDPEDTAARFPLDCS